MGVKSDAFRSANRITFLFLKIQRITFTYTPLSRQNNNRIFPKVNLRFLKDVANYLEHDIRMDMDEFYNFDVNIFEEYIKVGKKADSIATLLKFLRR